MCHIPWTIAWFVDWISSLVHPSKMDNGWLKYGSFRFLGWKVVCFTRAISHAYFALIVSSPWNLLGRRKQAVLQWLVFLTTFSFLVLQKQTFGDFSNTSQHVINGIMKTHELSCTVCYSICFWFVTNGTLTGNGWLIAVLIFEGGMREFF